MPLILVINCGSSSLKFAVIESEEGTVLTNGLAERLNTPEAVLHLRLPEGEKRNVAVPRVDHSSALDRILEQLGDTISQGKIAGVGHRVVHGGEVFSESVRIDEDVVKKIVEVSGLAPLHNPASLSGIAAALHQFPALPHVAVFDTAFHQTMPLQAFMYALPYDLYQRHKIRRYGFHGTSHRYVAGEAARRIGKPLEDLQMITAHLGNGCSACALKDGKSVDTTMGLTPSEGLVMGTRSGDVDPNLHQFIAEKTGRSLAEITDLLNRKSGLLGLSGHSNDMRALVEAESWGNPHAAMAINVFCYRLAKGILGIAAGLDRVDALIFTGGIGENSQPVRARTLEHLGVLGAKMDVPANENHGKYNGGIISAADSRVLCMVVPTNEELVIARETARFLNS
ncbi:MAG TPA: acetate kinase [Chthoniobacterales bacterium]